MNFSKINIHRFRFVFDRKTINKHPFFCRYAPCFWIKIFCSVVIFPCFIEFALGAPSEKVSEINESLIMTLETSNQNISNVLGSSWRHKSGNFRRESEPKLNGSVPSSADGVIQPCTTKPDKAANNSSAQCGDNWEDSAIHIFIALLATLVFGVLGAWLGASMPVMYNHSFDDLLPRRIPNSEAHRAVGSGAAQG